LLSLFKNNNNNNIQISFTWFNWVNRFIVELMMSCRFEYIADRKNPTRVVKGRVPEWTNQTNRSKPSFKTIASILDPKLYHIIIYVVVQLVGMNVNDTIHNNSDASYLHSWRLLCFGIASMYFEPLLWLSSHSSVQSNSGL